MSSNKYSVIDDLCSVVYLLITKECLFLSSLLRLHGVEWSNDSIIRKRREFGRKQSNVNRGNVPIYSCED